MGGRGRRKKDHRSCGRDWAGLDRDILMLVFLKLGTLEVLRVAEAVCRPWRRVATEEPELWRRVDMANHGYGSDAFVLMDPTRVAVGWSKGRLEEFSMEYLGDDHLLRFLSDRTSVLKKLCLVSCFQVSQIGIAETAKRQPLLEDLEIIYGSFEEDVTEVIGRECPQLKSFKFNTVWYTMPPFENEDELMLLDDDEALGIANNMHELRHLQLIGNRMTNRGLTAILDGCPYLEILDIRRCRNVKMDGGMWARCAKIKTIRLPEDSVNDYQYGADNDRDLSDVNFWFGGRGFI